MKNAKTQWKCRQEHAKATGGDITLNPGAILDDQKPEKSILMPLFLDESGSVTERFCVNMQKQLARLRPSLFGHVRRCTKLPRLNKGHNGARSDVTSQNMLFSLPAHKQCKWSI